MRNFFVCGGLNLAAFVCFLDFFVLEEAVDIIGFFDLSRESCGIDHESEQQSDQSRFYYHGGLLVSHSRSIQISIRSAGLSNLYGEIVLYIAPSRKDN